MNPLLVFQLRRVARNRQYLVLHGVLPAASPIFFTKIFGAGADPPPRATRTSPAPHGLDDGLRGDRRGLWARPSGRRSHRASGWLRQLRVTPVPQSDVVAGSTSPSAPCWRCPACWWWPSSAGSHHGVPAPVGTWLALIGVLWAAFHRVRRARPAARAGARREGGRRADGIAWPPCSPAIWAACGCRWRSSRADAGRRATRCRPTGTPSWAGTRGRGSAPRRRVLSWSGRGVDRRVSPSSPGGGAASARCTPSPPSAALRSPAWTCGSGVSQLAWALPWLPFQAVPGRRLVTEPRPLGVRIAAGLALVAFTVAYLVVFGRPSPAAAPRPTGAGRGGGARRRPGGLAGAPPGPGR